MAKIYQFPISREYIRRRVEVAADKCLSDVGEAISVCRFPGEVDVDLRKRILAELKGK